MNIEQMNEISIEKFAAYLDGNLSPNEMTAIDSLVTESYDLQEVVMMSDIIDEQISQSQDIETDLIFQTDELMNMLNQTNSEIDSHIFMPVEDIYMNEETNTLLDSLSNGTELSTCTDTYEIEGSGDSIYGDDIHNDINHTDVDFIL